VEAPGSRSGSSHTRHSHRLTHPPSVCSEYSAPAAPEASDWLRMSTVPSHAGAGTLDRQGTPQPPPPPPPLPTPPPPLAVAEAAVEEKRKALATKSAAAAAAAAE